ncbi:uncharacterized protein C2845_PM01G01050 [Panicum miliaceum]|uniref:DUF4378 domain-containing protein n=1 Tax=Panicum miliaceum TaxID=4540 RepID=A0A3L6TIM8_PANMI|nr:uncharacterized protein C2845_PM01G01050 [Panicum miliaceum]
MAARGPLTLRDFLELACDSSSDGFRSYPRCLPWTDDALQAPVRLLVEADPRRSPSRSPSSLFSLARISSLSRSFSRRIKEGFWRRREDEDDDLFFDDRDFPSPLVSSCSASSDSASEYAESEVDIAIGDEKMAFECDKPSTSASSSSTTSTDGAPCAAADGKKKMQAVAAAGGDPAVVGRISKLGMEEDKQQLSPVSVLDFPFDDDDGDERSDAGTCSPSFHRTTKQQAHKIRRYDGIAQAVDLKARFTTTTSESGESVGASTHHPTTSSTSTDTASSATSTTTAPRHGEEHQCVEQKPRDQEKLLDEYRLLAQLLLGLEDAAAAAVDDVSQVLVLDFFAEGVDRLRASGAGSVVGTVRPADDDRLVGAAAEWLRGAGPQWGIRDVMLSGEAALEDMERGRRWMCAGEEERDVGAAVEGFVVDGLLDELVAELVLDCWL